MLNLDAILDEPQIERAGKTVELNYLSWARLKTLFTYAATLVLDRFPLIVNEVEIYSDWTDGSAVEFIRIDGSAPVRMTFAATSDLLAIVDHALRIIKNRGERQPPMVADERGSETKHQEPSTNSAVGEVF